MQVRLNKFSTKTVTLIKTMHEGGPARTVRNLHARARADVVCAAAGFTRTQARERSR